MKYATVATVVDREFVWTHYGFCITYFCFRTSIAEFFAFSSNVNDISILHDVVQFLLFAEQGEYGNHTSRLGALFVSVGRSIYYNSLVQRKILKKGISTNYYTHSNGMKTEKTWVYEISFFDQFCLFWISQGVIFDLLLRLFWSFFTNRLLKIWNSLKRRKCHVKITSFS